MRVADLMSQPAVTCAVDDSLEHVARLMWDHDIGCVPVVDRGGVLRGMLTDRDVCMGAYVTGRPLIGILAGEIMTEPVVAVGPEATIAEAEARMREEQIRRVPVIDPTRRPIGLLSLNDLAREAEDELGYPRRPLDTFDTVGVLHTLAAISQPRSVPIDAPHRT